MPDATFPTAEKVVFYQVDGALYLKCNQRDAIARPDAIRAVFGDTIIWLLPTSYNKP